MERTEFRIEEYNGRFRVQRLFEEESGCGRKKKITKEWRNVDEDGCRPFYFKGIAIRESMKSFKTLIAAEDMIAVIIKGKIYH